MRRWVLAFAVIGFSQTAVAAELEFLRGSVGPAYIVTQVAPLSPDDPALRLNPPASAANRGCAAFSLELDRLLYRRARRPGTQRH
jgi:hypothetical protein